MILNKKEHTLNMLPSASKIKIGHKMWGMGNARLLEPIPMGHRGGTEKPKGIYAI